MSNPDNNHSTAQSQEVAAKVDFLATYFFSRFDLVAHLQSMGNPAPGFYDGGQGTLRGIIEAHVTGNPLPKGTILKHEGSATIELGRAGTYTPDVNNLTRWACIDFDGKKADKKGHAVNLENPLEAAIKALDRVKDAQIQGLLEFTNSGAGYHLWLLFSEPIEAKTAQKLALLLTPDTCKVEGSKDCATPGRSPLEVFPKQTKLTKKDGFGNLVWLPLWHGSEQGRGQFVEPLDEFTTKTIEPWTWTKDKLVITPEEVDIAIQTLEDIGYKSVYAPPKKEREHQAKGEHRPVSSPQSDASWKEWRSQVLAAIDIEEIYKEFLVPEKTRSDGSIELHDVYSLSNCPNKPSRVVNTAHNGRYERGAWHSWRTGEHGSVFDYLVEQGQASDVHKAMQLIAKKTGIPTPSELASLWQLREWEAKLLEDGIDQRNSEMFPEQEESNRAIAHEATEAKLQAATKDASRPVIDGKNGDLRDILKNAMTVLRGARTVDGHPRFYRYAGLTAQISRDENGIAYIEPMTPPTMSSALAQEAFWVEHQKTGPPKPVYPPEKLPIVLVADRSPDLPIIQRVTQAPIFSPDGKVSTKPGYQHDSRTYYVKRRGQELPEVPANPTAADIQSAISWIDELLWDFPFEKDGKTPGTSSSRANAIALMLLGFVREMIPGPTPFHLVDAPMMGTGKGLLAECLMHAFLGHPLISVQWPKNQEEQGKQITSTLLAGQSVFYLDNLEGAFGGSYICSVTTQPMWAARILGISKDANLPVRQVFIGSGNNVQVQKDMVRRVVPIRLNAQTVDAAARTGWRHPQPRWAFENRAMLVHSALVLVQAWISKGMHKGSVVYGSYDDYAGVMSGILENAGISGFLENLKSVANNDQSEGGLVSFMSEWWEAMRSLGELSTVECGAKELYLIAERSDLELGGKDDRGGRHKLGQLLTKNRDRVFKIWSGEEQIAVKLVFCRTRKNAAMYRLDRIC